MQITLLSFTPEPEKSIAAAFLNMGIGKDITDLSQITDEEAAESLGEIFKSHLSAPLEYASFNLFWDGIPLFLRAQLVRHRVGWGFAERSMRFFDANLRNPVEGYDWDAMPTVKGRIGKHNFLRERDIQEMVEREMKRQMELYSMLLEEGVDQQDARNIIGVWYPTAMQTTCTYRALRAMMADRLSSQAHPFWQKAAHQIKDLITGVSPILGAALVDSCEIAGRCVWGSKFDRGCPACVERGRKKAHHHLWNRHTTFGPNTQCNCGVMKPKQIEMGGSNDNN
jgi:flavin-dependent thymidylate synthase